MTYQFMLERLALSLLVPDDIDATPEFGTFGTSTATPIGFRIPYHRPDGTLHPHMHRVRLENPTKDGKYTQPSREEIEKAGGEGTDSTYPYLPHKTLGGATWASLAAQPKHLYIIEGELKAACVGKVLTLPAIGIGGCWGGVRRSPDGTFQLHPVIKALLQSGDRITIVLDGDITYNPDVSRAAGTLRRVLNRLGFEPEFVILPEGADGRKVGVDDFLRGNGGSKQAFDALPRTNGHGFSEDRETLWDYLGLQPGGVAKTPICNEYNVMQVLTKHERFDGKLYYDEALDRVILDGEVVDNKFGRIVLWMQEHICHRWKRGVIVDSLSDISGVSLLRQNSLHDWITREKWDGTDRLIQVGPKVYNSVDDEYTRAVFRNWFIGAVARAYRPGCQMDTMLVLEGPQGVGKSRSLEIIGGPFYRALTGDLKNKDFVLTANNGWICDVDELGSFRRTDDFDHIKATITIRTDNIRSHYDRTSKERPRKFVFAGTTNRSNYLRDDTGNRRFLPVACYGFPAGHGTVKIEEVWLTTNLAQLWAEAKHKFDTGETWWEFPTALTQAMQEARMEIDPWESHIASMFDDPTCGHLILSNTHKFISTDELLFALGVAIKDMTVANRQRASRCARRVAEAHGGWTAHDFDSRTAKITLNTGNTVDRARGWKKAVVGALPPGNVTTLRGKF